MIHNMLILRGLYMNNLKLFFISLASIILLGAGCSGTDEMKDTSDKTVASKNLETQTKETIPENPQKTDELVLIATAVGNNAVNFEWKVADRIAESSEGWRILYGTEPNPTYPSTWWFERSKPHRKKLWSGLPAGHAYFRLCKVVGEACMSYSNNVEVDIPGEGLTTTTTQNLNNTSVETDN